MKQRLLIPLSTAAAALAAGLFLAATPAPAQDGPPPGNFDPAQMRQRMMDNLKERFEVTDDSEWKVISERIAKVMELRRGAGGFGGGPMGFGGPGGPPGGGPNGGDRNGGGPDGGPNGGPQPGMNDGPGQGGGGGGQGGFRPGPGGPGGPGGFGRPSTPEMQALRKAVEAKAANAELKRLMEEVKTARAKRQSELEKAQAQLREVLTTKQEAVALTMGLL